MHYLILTILILLFTYFLSKINKRKNYFKKWGIPSPQTSFVSEIIELFRRRHPNYAYSNLYNLNKEAKYIGYHMLADSIIVLRDPDLIKSVLVKNFDSFAHHKEFVKEELDPLFGKNLAFLNGEKWREVRTMLSPAFTSSKMRTMYTLMSECAEKFVNKFLELYKDESDIEVKEAFSKFANDLIATCAYGIEINSLENPNNQFYLIGRRFLNFDFITFMKFMIVRLFPSLVKPLNIRVISKEDTDFFINVVETAVKTRDENRITRPDMLQLMMDARSTTSNLNIIEMTAQAFIFFLGGFDTTSNQMTMIAHELATNPSVQEKLQAEIDKVMEETNGKPTYEDVNNMVYLDAVFNETLRMHPMSMVSRVCSKDFELPPALPGSKPYLVKVGDEVHVPMVGIHHDPKYYDNPSTFEPERFIKINKKTTMSDVTSLGFGLGPRMCIGNRFAILETKALFIHLLHKCSLEVSEKTCIPLEYNKKIFAPSPKGGAWLKIKTRY